jgi:hypothetical protein
MELMNNFNIDDFNSKIYEFLLKHRSEECFFKLTTNSEFSIFSHGFGIFILNSIKKLPDYEIHFLDWGNYISKEILNDADDLHFRFNKSKMQKLCFGLSALHLINITPNKDIDNLIFRILDYNIEVYLKEIGFFDNKSQSANFCMFYGVLLIYCQEKLKIDKSLEISNLINIQIGCLDSNGFFNRNKFSHLAFQNFYHQFEIFEYLNIQIPNIENGISKILSLNRLGNFRNAPYFGSSGCYDFDALSIVITSKKMNYNYLNDFFSYILDQQNYDYGFSESRNIRPLNIKYFFNSFIHILTSNNFFILKERLMYIINYMHPKYNKIDTHWTKYSREWNESNLWDTWLKIQIIYKILLIHDTKYSDKISFINFPGMGYFKSKK